MKIKKYLTDFAFLLLLLGIFVGCSKKMEEPANLNVKVSYYYNAFIGYKPDVGATAFLYEEKFAKQAYTDSISWVAASIGALIDKNGEYIIGDNGLSSGYYKYRGEADVTGTVTIAGVSPGGYLLILVSKGRYTFSSKHIDIQSGTDMVLIKNFGYYHEFDDGGEYW